jgi:segregation and condensation protein B
MDALLSKIESLLFISGRPMSVREIADLLKIEQREVDEACEKLLSLKKDCSAGTQVIKNGGSFQMVTSPENAALVQEFVKDETTGELSRPSLETLTIIAYRGPISKTDLDRIRGVNCGMILHNLLMRGLIDAREDKKKEESYYTVTFDFIKFLGLNEVKDLPDYERLHADDTIDKILAENSENNQEDSGQPVVEAASEESIPESVPTDEMTEDQKVAVLAEALAEIAEPEIAKDGGEAVEIELSDDEEFEDEEDDEDDEEEGGEDK